MSFSDQRLLAVAEEFFDWFSDENLDRLYQEERKHLKRPAYLRQQLGGHQLGGQSLLFAHQQMMAERDYNQRRFAPAQRARQASGQASALGLGALLGGIVG